MSFAGFIVGVFMAIGIVTTLIIVGLLAADARRKLTSSSDGGCGGHHFDEYEPKNRYDSEIITQRQYKHEDDEEWGEWTTRMCVADWADRRVRDAVQIRQKHVSTCEHSGCGKESVRWREYEVYPIDDE